MYRQAFLLGVLALGCSDPIVSQVMIEVDADAIVRARAVSLVFRVSGGGRERDQVTGCRDDDPCQVQREELFVSELPVLIALAPDKRDWRRLYEASVTAYDGPNGSGNVLGSTRVVSGYVRGETRTIRLFLQGSCLGVDCDDPDLTCRGGDCVDPFIPPDELDPFVRPDASDDGALDGGMDAAMCATGADCDDGVVCTFDDCVVGSCRNTPRDEMCPDPGDPCLDALCDLVMGCTTTPNNSACDDGDICNGTDQCRDGACANIGPERCPAPLTCEADGSCTGCTGGDCPGTLECMDGTCICNESPAEVMETSCDDLVDNDCDGLVDCADPNCAGVVAEVCDGATDEDCDLSIDEGCSEVDCSNGLDDDMDALVDCDDDDCTDASCMRGGMTGFCAAILPGCCALALPEGCGETEDWNCDGFTMTDCVGDGGSGDGSTDAGSDAGFDAGFGDTFDECMLMTEVCNNGVDDNCNDLMDCEEPICDLMPCDFGTGTCMGMVCVPSGGDASMGETICDDMFDNDGDGFTDCVDADCADQACLTVPFMNPGFCSCTPGAGGMCSPGTCIGGVSMDAGI